MFSKYIFALGTVLMFTAIVQCISAETVEDDTDEDRNPALAIAVRIIMQAVKWAAKHCATEAAHNCKQNWKNPKELVRCAKEFLEANKGRCVTG